MDKTITFSIPSWANPFGASDKVWLLVVMTLAVALLASIAVEIIKRHKNAKEQEKLAKKYVALLLTAFTSLFTAAGYFIAFAQTNAPLLDAVPFLGRHVPQAVGAAYVLYDLRLNKSFSTFRNWASRWSKSETVQYEAPAQPQAEPILPDRSLLS